MNEQNDKRDLPKIQGLQLILKSLNCEKYQSNFEYYGINEHSMLYLTANDLRLLGVDSKDITTIMMAINALNKTLDLRDIQLSNEDVLKIQRNICGQLGFIALDLNKIYHSINSEHFEDMLIDRYLSSINAALMLQPYLREEKNQMEKILNKTLKAPKKRKVILATITVCSIFLFGYTLWHKNYSFNSIPLFSNRLSQMKIRIN